MTNFIPCRCGKEAALMMQDGRNLYWCYFCGRVCMESGEKLTWYEPEKLKEQS